MHALPQAHRPARPLPAVRRWIATDAAPRQPQAGVCASASADSTALSSVRTERNAADECGSKREAPPKWNGWTVNAIEEALAPVLRDVSSTTDLHLRIEDGDWSDELGPYVRIAAPDGSATSVHINLANTEAERIVAAAEQVQDIVIEEHWARASNWPMCPAHRSTHPLQVALRSTEAWWTCPADQTAVSPVGALRL